jgi:hypothetical protein
MLAINEPRRSHEKEEKKYGLITQTKAIRVLRSICSLLVCQFLRPISQSAFSKNCQNIAHKFTSKPFNRNRLLLGYRTEKIRSGTESYHFEKGEKNRIPLSIVGCM